MYARRISTNMVPTQHNLKSVIPERRTEIILTKYRLLVRKGFTELRNMKNLKERIDIFVHKVKTCREGLFVKPNPERVLRMWARQFECVFAQRVRRGQQMICSYTRWWEERALKEFLRRLRISINRNGKEFVIGALGVSVFNWEEKRISDEEFNTHLNDLEYINVLKEETMCLSCSKGEKSTTNTRICKCGTGGVTNKTYDKWEPFIEKDDLIVWRRPHGDGLFEYKVYGSYHDVSAEDFLNVQVDMNYRKEWDTTAVQLEIGEKDPQDGSNSDILYWEMQWPRLFVNRDYVFNRRYKVFKETRQILIINKTTEYPKFPKYPDKYRVEDYWSCMVIRPYNEMDKLGIEFSLTYFDNPGVNIPASVTTWVAKSAMPDYLAKLRYASKHYKEYCLRKGVSKACEIYKNEERERREAEEKNKLEYCSNDKLSLILHEIFEDFQKKAQEKLIRLTDFKHIDVSEKSTTVTEEAEPEQATKETNNNFWKYLHPLYYFT